MSDETKRAPKKRRKAAGRGAEPKLSPEGRRPRASLKSILQSDYASVLCLIAPLVCWGLFLAFEVFGLSTSQRGRVIEGGKTPFFLIMACTVTSIAIPLFVYRVTSIMKIFREGTEVIGEITMVLFFKDRGNVDYAFEHNGKPYKVSRGLHKSKRAAALEPGKEVVIIFDPENPKAAYIRDLFT